MTTCVYHDILSLADKENLIIFLVGLASTGIANIVLGPTLGAVYRLLHTERRKEHYNCKSLQDRR